MNEGRDFEQLRSEEADTDPTESEQLLQAGASAQHDLIGAEEVPVSLRGTEESERAQTKTGQFRQFIEQVKTKAAGFVSQKIFANPLGKGQDFDPERELEQIRHAPKEEREEMVRKFKERLVFQKEGLARLQEQLIDIIWRNPDASPDKIYKTAFDLGARYGMSENQKDIARSLVHAYAQRHARIREIRQQYANSDELFRALFGELPKGKIEVIEGPATICFRCYDPADYALVWGKDITLEQERKLSASVGVAINGALLPGLNHGVIAEKVVEHGNGKSDLAERERIRLHEEQHALKAFFEEKFSSSAEEAAWQEFFTATSRAQAEQLFERFLRIARQQEEEYARDEILACFKDGAHSAEDILDKLAKPAEEGGVYDFLARERGYIGAWTDKFYTGREYGEWLRGAAKKAFGEEYHNVLKESIDAFERLRYAGYSTAQAIALLIHEPLSRWKKVVDRQLGGASK